MACWAHVRAGGGGVTSVRSRLIPRALHTTNRPSATAQWTTLFRALELGRPAGDRIVTDRFAPAFLTGPFARAFDPLNRAAPLLRMVERRDVVGIATSVLCRHRFIDAHLLQAVPETAQVVVLGAGYDSRAYRFAHTLGSRPVFEVDLAPLSRRKAAVVDSRPDLFDRARVRRVEIDFRTESLEDRLLAHGFAAGAPTFVVWEGVTPYLSRVAVVRTLRTLSDVCGRGSVLAMDLWQPVGGLGPYAQLRRGAVRGLALIGEPLTFSVRPDGAENLLAEAGFELVDLAEADRLTARYATDGRRCDDGLYLVAAALR